MMEDKLTLKPCPFCGSKVSLMEIASFRNRFKVACLNPYCHVQPHMKTTWLTEDGAIKAWNRRAENKEAEQ